MGLNEFAGYFAVGVVAFLTGMIAEKYGIRPYPFYIGIFFALLGLLLTAIWVEDTAAFVKKEAAQHHAPQVNMFWETTFRNKTLSAVTQAGLVNNLNDGMMWGLFPVLLLSAAPEQRAFIVGVYPAVWGIGQLFTGKMSDVYPKKSMLFWGMLLQGLAIMLLPFYTAPSMLMLMAGALGLGTALVYPTFLSAIAQASSPMQRAESIGTFRLWRDLGYAFGAVLSGIAADRLGVASAIVMVGAITVLSALVIQWRMPAHT
jgi:MFS family permease